MKSEWKNVLAEIPEYMRHFYETYDALVDQKTGNWIARIEQFKADDKCFYANTADERSGCICTYEWARQWCESKTMNKVN